MICPVFTMKIMKSMKSYLVLSGNRPFCPRGDKMNIELAQVIETLQVLHDLHGEL